MKRALPDGSAFGTDGANSDVLDAPPSDARLLNLSTRGLAQTGDNVLIPGFVIQGTESKRLLIRAVGPTLALDPFNVPGVLPDPRMVLKRWNGSTFVDFAANDNWGDNPDAAFVVTLQPGIYTVVGSSADGTSTGVAIVEVYVVE